MPLNQDIISSQVATLKDWTTICTAIEETQVPMDNLQTSLKILGDLKFFELESAKIQKTLIALAPYVASLVSNLDIKAIQIREFILEWNVKVKAKENIEPLNVAVKAFSLADAMNLFANAENRSSLHFFYNLHAQTYEHILNLAMRYFTTIKSEVKRKYVRESFGLLSTEQKFKVFAVMSKYHRMHTLVSRAIGFEEVHVINNLANIVDNAEKSVKSFLVGESGYELANALNPQSNTEDDNVALLLAIINNIGK